MYLCRPRKVIIWVHYMNGASTQYCVAYVAFIADGGVFNAAEGWGLPLPPPRPIIMGFFGIGCLNGGDVRIEDSSGGCSLVLLTNLSLQSASSNSHD